MPVDPKLLWAGMLVPPIAFLANEAVGFILVPWACANGWKPWLYAAWIFFLLIAVAAGALAWHSWRETGREWPDQSGGAVARSRFMAVGGVLLSAMFFLVILAHGITTLILGACQ